MGCLRLPYKPTLTFEKSSKSACRGYMFGFNGQEKQDEVTGTGNTYDLGARFYEGRLGRMFSNDPREAEYPWQSTYAYFKNSPIRQLDFNGAGEQDWKWDDAGNLVAELDDNVATLATFLNTTTENASEIVKRNNSNTGATNSTNVIPAQKINQNEIYYDVIPEGVPIVNNTAEALLHYYNGHGKPAFPGVQSMHDVISSKKFRSTHAIIAAGKQKKDEGYFNVDLNVWNTEGNSSTFHIGNVQTAYTVAHGISANTVKYKFFHSSSSAGGTDGFWDPDYADEKIADGVRKITGWQWPGQSPDGPGPNLELPGGTPYYYIASYRFYFVPPLK
jgi:RHS repeat-associated protein